MRNLNIAIATTMVLLILVGFIPKQGMPQSVENDIQKKVETTTVAPSVSSVVQPENIPSLPVPTPETPKRLEDNTCSDFIAEAEKYDWNINIISAISMAESGCRADIVGDGHLTYYQGEVEYGYSYSFLQIRYLPGREGCYGNIETYVACAYALYQDNYYRPWSVYNDGQYLKFL
jgi:hypothetical protein